MEGKTKVPAHVSSVRNAVTGEVKTLPNFYEPETLVNRLRGIYDVGPDAEFGVRDFSESELIWPIHREASARIEELETKILILEGALQRNQIDITKQS